MKTTITNEVLNIHVSMDGDDTSTGRTPIAKDRTRFEASRPA